MLHIGGARAALFNFLFARHHGGQYLLRIEDTDRERSTQANSQAILDGLAWLDLSPDEPPVFQSTRQARHTEVALQMLEAGRAYRCWLSADELKAMREQAQAAGQPFRVRSPWRDRDARRGPRGRRPGDPPEGAARRRDAGR
jgi:glutamyl-tRNA synthetase